jgi:hypothetical protein
MLDQGTATIAQSPRRRALRQKPKFGRPMPLDLWWDYRTRPPTVTTVLMAARAAMVWQDTSPMARFAIALRFVNWLTLVPEAAICLLRMGGAVCKETHRTRWTQLRDVLRLSGERSVPPRAYYQERIYRIAETEAERAIVPYALYATVANGLVADRDPEILACFRNKKQFADVAFSRGVPAVPTLALIKDGKDANVAALPPIDMIVKPAIGGQGRDVEGWRWVKGDFVSHDGRSLTEANLRAYLADYATRAPGGALVQPRLFSHASFAEFGGDALSTTRVVTLRGESGEPEIVEAFLRVATRKGAIVDNYHAGGWIFPVDLSTGRLRMGRAEDARLEFCGPQIAGRQHPDWTSVAEVALLAHRAFPTLLISGWDIAITESGIVVLEANVPPGISLGRQMLYGGVAVTRMFELLAWHARLWLEQNVPEGSRWRVPDPVAPDD